MSHIIDLISNVSHINVMRRYVNAPFGAKADETGRETCKNRARMRGYVTILKVISMGMVKKRVYRLKTRVSTLRIAI